MKSMRAVLLDASALIQGFEAADEKYFTVREVVEEVKNRIARIRIETYISSNKLIIRSPKSTFIERLESMTVKMGESIVLSPADKKFLSLALQMNEEGYDVILITEDYSVQNMAKELGIGYRSLATPGIKRRISWTIYCPGCYKIFDEPQPNSICPVCATRLKRRPSKPRG